MRLSKPLIPATVSLLLFAACASSGNPPETSSESKGLGSEDSLAPGEQAGEEKEGAGDDKGGGSDGPSRKDPGKDGDASGGSGGGEGTTGEGGAGHEADKGSRADRPGGGAPASAGGAAWPAAGTYVYAQDGFEEFCSPQCERYALPPKQRIETSHSSRSATGAVVVTRARASGDRLVKTTTRYTDTAARVLEVHLAYSYEGFDFSRTYRPSPPVASLKFPLRSGRTWSGSWQGDVSGSYSVEVEGRESFSGSPVARLGTTTRFRGDFEGRANVTMWVDPRDGTVMKTAGNMTVEMGFGTYRTGFATALRTGP
jgi:hypothetical protein